jgi:hypothetical protein
MNQTDYFKSKEFKERIEQSIQRETWGKGLPRYYLDKEGRVVEHWKDGTIKVIKEKMNKEQTIYVAYDSNDCEILCAWTDEERAKKDCEESGVSYQKVILYL